jgi:hypothetical protein
MSDSVRVMTMGEVSDQARPRSLWYSGLCLDGEVAGQYQVDVPVQQGVIRQSPGRLYFDDLAPINIFVGANNSGKSRLLRELYSSSLYQEFRLSSLDENRCPKFLDDEVKSWIIQGMNNNTLDSDSPELLRFITKEGWIVRDQVSFALGAFNDRITGTSSGMRQHRGQERDKASAVAAIAEARKVGLPKISWYARN